MPNVTYNFDRREEFKYTNRLIKKGTLLEYLTFTASGDTVFQFKIYGTLTATPTIEYCIDNNGTWTNYTFGTDISLTNGHFINFRGDNNSFSESYNCYIYMVISSGYLYASGNVMSLVDKTCQSITIPSIRCFIKLFSNCTRLLSVPELPATTLTTNCYGWMFNSCSGLITLPSDLLPATTLADSCYNNMFSNCANLTNVCSLPATVLVYGCYFGMFSICPSLIILPKLSATTLANNCYSMMFRNCSSIKMSETQTSEYVNAFTFGAIPSSTYAPNMFSQTGGTFTGTLTAQTYYTSNTIK